jgi:hypothetical protein
MQDTLREGDSMRLNKRYLVGLLAVAIGVLIPGQASAASSVSLVAWGLDSPRGVAFVGSKAFVAEGGHGSNSASDCFSTPFGNTCVGNTSQISWVNTTTGAHAPLAKGFFSITLGAEGSIGVSGLSYRGGKLYAQIGATGREVPPNFAIGHQAGNLIAVNPKTGKWTTVAAVGNNDFDYTVKNFTPPDPSCGQCNGRQEHDANPTDVIATSEGLFVADSGSNTLTSVGEHGKTSILYHFPWRDPNPNNFPSDEVPTCVASSGDSFWIGTLSGHLFQYNEGKVTQVWPKDGSGHALLSHTTGCTADGDTLYLVNMFGAGQFGDPTFPNGNVVTYNTETGKGSVIADAFHNPSLFFPYMVKVGPDGNLWVTAGAICGADGTTTFAGGHVPCSVGNKKGGRLLMISLPHEEDNHSSN